MNKTAGAQPPTDFLDLVRVDDERMKKNYMMNHLEERRWCLWLRVQTEEKPRPVEEKVEITYLKYNLSMANIIPERTPI